MWTVVSTPRALIFAGESTYLWSHEALAEIFGLVKCTWASVEQWCMCDSPSHTTHNSGTQHVFVSANIRLTQVVNDVDLSLLMVQHCQPAATSSVVYFFWFSFWWYFVLVLHDCVSGWPFKSVTKSYQCHIPWLSFCFSLMVTSHVGLQWCVTDWPYLSSMSLFMLLHFSTFLYSTP